MLKKVLSIFLLISFFTFIIVSCNEDDEQVSIQELMISSFEIVSNEKNGVITRTKISSEILAEYDITDHGVIWLDKNTLIDKLQLGKLENFFFEATLYNGLIKGQTYFVYPYLRTEFGTIYGDTLSFKSNVEIDVSITGLSPRNGFIRDTIVIIGKNFCTSSFNNSNSFLLDESYHEVIFESDSLIKTVVSPYLKASELKPSLKSCGIITNIDGVFSIDLPKLDSISNKNLYVGEELVVYGKNIHNNISKVWLEGIETELITTDSITLLKIKVPENLPSGKLDFKLQVLDKIIEKEDYYQSTTPVIEEVTPRSTGFLDTLTIKGKFLDQRSDVFEVIIGNQVQNIISKNDEEIKVIIDQLFTVDNPELILNTGTFSLSEPITMLPPQILSFDKKKYHIEDNIIIKTKYYLGDRNTAKIGDVIANTENAYSQIDYDGTFNVNLKEWLNVKSLYPEYNIKSPGLIEVFIETNYGSSSLDFSIYSPEITKINKASFFHESSIVLEGNDFGYDRGYIGVGKIYINDILIPDPGISTYSLHNQRAQVPIPNTLYPGNHKIKIITGGQESNEVSFTIKSLSANDLNPKVGTRKDTYIIEGSNLEDTYSYIIKANGHYCDKLNATQNQVKFRLPQSIELDPTTTITIEYGPQVINVGTINIIEPYERIPEYQFSLADYHLGSFGFEYNGMFHYINRHGIYRLNNNSYIWDKIENNVPSDLSFSNGKINPPIINNKLFIYAVNNTFKTYDLITQTWESKGLDIEAGLFINRAVAIDNNNLILALSEENFGSTSFYKYNLNTDQKEQISSPPNFEINAGNAYFFIFYSSGDKVYLSSPNFNVMVYNTITNVWTDIGHPKSSNFFYDMNLYEYNNVLYFSGGQGNIREERGLFTYDIQTKQWEEKTPMLNVMRNHFVFGLGQDLYFLLGNGLYGHENKELMKYNIDVDPN
ncbi:IPT/TIG domain-containing protein [Aquimarina longa]|uniref:IPT/TIG domain-containing protein n=1 Tax=Aquimarina longa TaxID=1080221 RepID=UPI0007856F85|nr:IPT/TIG domain-containing protein [Aquimarina longa]